MKRLIVNGNLFTAMSDSDLKIRLNKLNHEWWWDRCLLPWPVVLQELERNMEWKPFPTEGPEILLRQGLSKTYYNPETRCLRHITNAGKEFTGHWEPGNPIPDSLYCFADLMWSYDTLKIFWHGIYSELRLKRQANTEQEKQLHKLTLVRK